MIRSTLRTSAFLSWGLFAALTGAAAADEPLTLENVVAPKPNEPDEPKARAFSLEKATKFLDTAALSWTKERGCFTCHTNYAYLYARPAITADVPEHRIIREQAEKLVTERWPEKGPRWDAEIIATAAALAFNDAATTGKLHPTTKTALDKIWEKQREDGGFKWIKCAWPPMENDDHYGVTLAAIAVGVAPEDYQSSEPARKGLDGIRKYLKETPTPTLHHRLMILWAGTLLDPSASEDKKLMPDYEKQNCIDELLALQKEDGGWGSPSLYYWKRTDKKPQDMKSSDGYATGFSIYVLRRAGVASDHPQIKKGVAWLKANQRESGRWFTRSLKADNKHFLSHAGTAFAIMALKECDELKTADAK